MAPELIVAYEEPDWVSFEGKSYYLSTDEKTRSDATTFCKQMDR